MIAAVARGPLPSVLDSADAGPGRGRYTIVAFDPVEAHAWPAGGEDPFESMRGLLRRTVAFSEPAAKDDRHRGRPLDLASGPDSFLGWIGYFAYEAGRYIERLPATARDDLALPVARFAFYDSAAVYDAVTGLWTIVIAEPNDGAQGRTIIQAVCPTQGRPAGWAERRLAEWRSILAQAGHVEVIAPPPAGPAVGNMTRGRYLAQVARAREYIAAGDIFQVNFARRETFELREPPWRTYLRLRRVNPAAYGAYLAWEDTAILSSSPELFLELRGREAISRPIKGTRPRAGDPSVDAAYRAELAASPKDRAELAMIVDLVRNDLGRVCEYGSVRVVSRPGSGAWPYELETHPTVHHLVATVAGRLREECDAIDLVKACFPGGSITGAPKVRAMEIIDELEPTERSVYTGAIGLFGLDGSMTLNIAIRTLIATGGRVHLHAGGGIVADSVPEEEYEETVAKARGMHRAMGVELRHGVEKRA